MKHYENKANKRHKLEIKLIRKQTVFKDPGSIVQAESLTTINTEKSKS